MEVGDREDPRGTGMSPATADGGKRQPQFARFAGLGTLTSTWTLLAKCLLCHFSLLRLPALERRHMVKSAFLPLGVSRKTERGQHARSQSLGKDWLGHMDDH